jgi:dye decolorizing peroxidase
MSGSSDRAAAGPGRRAVLLSGLGGIGVLAGAAGLGACTSAGTAGASGASAGAGAGAGAGSGSAADTLRDASGHARARAFRGERQAGIIETPQTYAVFLAVDLPADADADSVRRLLTIWTDDAEKLMSGQGTLADLEPELAAVPAGITVTIGVGRRVPELTGAAVPSWLAPLPAYKIDKLQDRWSGGDLFVQVCANSPTTVAHAVRRMLTNMGSLGRVRWQQRGFREPFEGPGIPMRNLFGQVDGTVQPDVTGAESAMLWIGSAGPAWLSGGSTVVVRRIAMDMDVWDRVDRESRENAIGRHLGSGAPLTSPADAPSTAAADLDAKTPLGFHVIDDGSHLRRARGDNKEKILRRPYSYDDAPEVDPTTGRMSGLSNTGLIFVAYQADPMTQFAPMQARLAEKDLLNLWTTPIGSAVFAILPGAKDGEILGQALFG